MVGAREDRKSRPLEVTGRERRARVFCYARTEMGDARVGG